MIIVVYLEMSDPNKPLSSATGRQPPATSHNRQLFSPYRISSVDCLLSPLRGKASSAIAFRWQQVHLTRQQLEFFQFSLFDLIKRQHSGIYGCPPPTTRRLFFFFFFQSSQGLVMVAVQETKRVKQCSTVGPCVWQCGYGRPSLVFLIKYKYP